MNCTQKIDITTKYIKSMVNQECWLGLIYNIIWPFTRLYDTSVYWNEFRNMAAYELYKKEVLSLNIADWLNDIELDTLKKRMQAEYARLSGNKIDLEIEQIFKAISKKQQKPKIEVDAAESDLQAIGEDMITAFIGGVSGTVVSATIHVGRCGRGGR